MIFIDEDSQAVFIYILLALGGLLFALVLFNTLLLSMAQYNDKKQEMIIRQVNGAARKHLYQLLFRMILKDILIAFIIMAAVIELLRPLVYDYFSYNIWGAFSNFSVYVILSGILLFVLCFNFLLPAIWSIKTLHKPKKLLTQKQKLKELSFFQSPLTFQVGISLVLLLFLLFINRQISFITNSIWVTNLLI
ncbi:MAG: hypothetical protein HC831_29670 [Chloroflexia bacterium]|nr:hypothetical protein [Chloroflexia bacterium]